MPDDLPTIPPHILEQFKVIVEAVTGVPTDKIVLLATVHEVDGESVAHVGVELDGRAPTPEETTLLNEVIAEAMEAGRRIAKLSESSAAFAPSKTLKDMQ